MADGLCTSCQGLLRTIDRWKKRDEQDRHRANTAEAEVARLRFENEHLRVALINCDQQRKEYQRRLDAISRNLDGFDLEADCG